MCLKVEHVYDNVLWNMDIIGSIITKPFDMIQYIFSYNLNFHVVNKELSIRIILLLFRTQFKISWAPYFLSIVWNVPSLSLGVSARRTFWLCKGGELYKAQDGQHTSPTLTDSVSVWSQPHMMCCCSALLISLRANHHSNNYSNFSRGENHGEEAPAHLLTGFWELETLLSQKKNHKYDRVRLLT